MSVEICSVIHFCDVRKLFRDDCLTQINKAYRPGTVSLSKVRRGNIAFASGKTTLGDNDRRGSRVNASSSRYRPGILPVKPFAFTRYIAEKPGQLRVAVLKWLEKELKRRKIKFQGATGAERTKQGRYGQNGKGSSAATEIRGAKMTRYDDP
jgi:hypothetical protein